MNGTILVVDDEPALRQLIAGALVSAGYCVLQARNGAEAALLFDDRGAEVDLVITDVEMPYVDGSQLIEALRQRRHSLKVLCISGTRQAPVGANAFIQKPFSRDALLAQVHTLLAP